MACAITWVGLTLVNVMHVVVVRTVGILGKQKEPWFIAIDGFCFKVYRPSLMLAEVVTLSLIIVKISQRHKVIQIDEEEDNYVFNAIQSSGALAWGNPKNKLVIRKLSQYSNNSMCDMIDADDQEEEAQMRKAS
jgi:uncharacterized membrane protein